MLFLIQSGHSYHFCYTSPYAILFNIMDPCTEFKVIHYRHLLIQRIVFRKVTDMLFDLMRIIIERLSSNKYFPFISCNIACNDLQRSRLPGPIWSQKAENLSCCNFQRDIVDCFLIAEPLCKVLNYNIHNKLI
jgi:hypothetical protein